MEAREEHRLFLKIRRSVQAYLGDPAIDEICWGSGYVDGEPRTTRCIRFNVAKKLPVARIPVGQLIPSSIAGVATDVTEFKFHTHAPEKPVRTEATYTPVQPLMGGVQVQVSDESASPAWGTLGGCIRIHGRYRGITAYHLLPDITLAAGVFQPKRSNFGRIIGWTGFGDNRLDYLLINLETSVDQTQSLNALGGRFTDQVQPVDLGSGPLTKSGAGSGVTTGIYDARSLSYPFRIYIRNLPGSSKPLSRPGDSGSVWVQKKGIDELQPVALHTGGEVQGSLARATLFTSIMPSIRSAIKRGLIDP